MPRKSPPSDQDNLICNFTGGAVYHRYLFGGGRGQSLPKAIGMKKDKSPRVVDATAGLGGDSFLLASLGAEVTLIERSPHMYKLLEDGMARAREFDNDIAKIMERMTLIYGDAIDLLPSLSPEIILVDPMHPERKKKSLVKIEMRHIRKLVGTDEDSVKLMQVSLTNAKKRVVLKWPRRADPMLGIRPCSHQILGKSTRYDVFMTG